MILVLTSYSSTNWVSQCTFISLLEEQIASREEYKKSIVYMILKHMIKNISMSSTKP